MRLDASAGPACLEVRRQFEPTRMASACQTLAYGQVLPVLDQTEWAALRSLQGDNVETASALLLRKGVAA